jgi:protein SCO1
MISKTRLMWGGAIAGLVGLAVWFALVLKADQGPNLSGKMSFDQKPGAQIPLDAEFKDEHGKTIRLGDYFGDRPVAIMFAFYRCKGSCLLEFAGALKSFRAMKVDDIGKTYEVVTIGIHPKETPDLALAKKQGYMADYNRPGTENGWHFLTGSEEQARRVADAVGFEYFYDAEKDMLVHPTGLIVATPGGKVSRYFIGTEYSAPFLRESILAAGVNEIGPVAQRTYFLGCFQVDPASGKTLIHVQRATQLMGVVTVIGLLSSILIMNRKYKRGRHDALSAKLEKLSERKEESAG